MFHTELCDLLGIKYPIIQGGMAWVATAELAAAVSNAGGLGIIGAGNAPPDAVRAQIRKAKALTDKPFGVNVYFMSPYVDDVMDVVIEERVAVVTTGAGNPGKYIPRLKEAGIKVIPVIASVALAQRLEKIGVDALIAEGMECGGHIGELTTMALVPQVVDAVKIPVIAAGGIADGRGFVAALSLGAKGVQMGTRFVCAKECTVHDNYKTAIINAKDRSTVVTGRPTGHPVRVLKNKLTRQFELLEKNGADLKDIEALGVGRLRAAAVEGDVENGSVMAGQIAGLIDDIKPAADIINDIVNEAKALLNKMAGVY
ncbi:enoyl-[acyl-carrier-protein] reductase FabK [Thermoanaerobacterium sp. DL9XJH110]|uniref:enoyl-[acyl-carrier-protein] reductase FabK n=1 Tax=Thermoanaerobacterium sp. DL9XJH110 TaxID=3386643 RepID=UPI003BB6C525